MTSCDAARDCPQFRGLAIWSTSTRSMMRIEGVIYELGYQNTQQVATERLRSEAKRDGLLVCPSVSLPVCWPAVVGAGQAQDAKVLFCTGFVAEIGTKKYF